MSTFSTQDIIDKAKLAHSDNNDYSKTNGKGGRSKVTQDEFLERARKKHGNNYDYSKTIYTGTDEKIIINCPEHSDFVQFASSHLRGAGCPVCSKTDGKGGRSKITQDEFLERARKKHGNYYDYSKTIYTGTEKKIIINCPEHGDFEKYASSHLKGAGCPSCVK